MLLFDSTEGSVALVNKTTVVTHEIDRSFAEVRIVRPRESAAVSPGCTFVLKATYLFAPCGSSECPVILARAVEALMSTLAVPSIQVGAINTRLLDVPWLGVRAIDLKSQHPRIEERDFFSLKPSEEYDVVSSRYSSR